MSDASTTGAGLPKGGSLVLVTAIGVGVAFSLGLVGLAYGARAVFEVELDRATTQRSLSVVSPKLVELRKSEQETLESYQTLDRTRGIYRIPVERAMELIATEARESKLQTATPEGGGASAQPGGGESAVTAPTPESGVVPASGEKGNKTP